RRLVPALGNGGGSVRFEPVAGSAADARWTALGQGTAWFFGEPGKFLMDHPGRQHGRQFPYSRLAHSDSVSAAAASLVLVRHSFFDGRVLVLHLFRFVAEDAVPHLSEPIMHDARLSFSLDSFLVKAACLGRRNCFQRFAPMARG